MHRKEIRDETNITENLLRNIDSSNEGYLLEGEPSSVQISNGSQTHQVQEKISVHSFVPIQLIGKGSFGEVYLVEKKKTKEQYAMKVLSK